jgi:hypothetical protein
MRQVYATLERANGHPGSGRLTEAINAYEPRHLRTRSDSSGRFCSSVKRRHYRGRTSTRP